MRNRTRRDRFIETARKLACGEGEDRFDATLERVVPKEDEKPANRSAP